MARKAIKIFGRKLTNMQMLLGAVGLAGLYFILSNRDTGIPLVDKVLEPIGDISGLEGLGQSYVPQVFGQAPAPSVVSPSVSGPAGSWSDWRFTNAYPAQVDYDEMRFSNAYKNE